ncbi:serine/threonine-protein kinase [Tahibacter harae]|uniref:Protein kinase n=1 Tax=Tahibacter harae TaxID=2963937 RepID=A0ABT1QPA7_9GAMM|nr:serine/threonine-protein kinase [Tahibacter harae]MCQ4164121.1 protein kinase [Tahibacter harae]
MQPSDPQDPRHLTTLADAGPSAAADAELPAQIGPYQILGLLGEGAMGRVYRARESQPPREVALKVMHALGRSALARFRREVELLAQLEHPGIARLYAASDAAAESTGPPWLALEYVRGRDLISDAHERGLDLDARLVRLIAICRAVQYAHGRGVIHRDLKPGNILVDADGQPKVLDFGIARLADGLARDMTQLGQVLGTVPYMSPEQLSGNSAAVDARSDVYALGCIAYELLSGRLPHPQLSASTLFEAIDIVRHQSPPPLGKVAAAARGDLETVVMKALAAEPERRYASAAEFAADLQRVREHRPVEARPPTVGYLIARFVRRHRLASAAAALSVLALVVASVVSLRLAWSEAAARREAEARAAEAGAVNGFLQRMLVSADPERSQGGDLTVRSVLDAAQAELAQAALPPLVAARVNLTLAGSFNKLGEGARAEALYAQALAQLDAAAPPALRDQLLVGQARALYAQKKYAAAEAVLAPLIARPAGQIEAETQLDARLAEAEGLGAQGKSAAAEEKLRPLLEDMRRELGEQHALSLATAQNLGSVLRLAGRYDEAIALARGTLAAHLQRFGPDHPQTLNLRSLLGALYELKEDNAAAEAEFRGVIEVRARVLGAAHPATLNAQQALASFLVRRGQADAGIALIRDVIAARRLRGEDDAPNNLLARNVLAYALEDQGRLAEAEAELRKVIAAQSRDGGPANAEAIGPRNNLAMLLLKQQRPADALLEFDALDKWMQANLPAGHPYFAIFASNRGECLARLGRWDEARQVLEGAHAGLVAKFGPGHERSRTAATRLAAVYRHQGDAARAAALEKAATP